MRPDLYFVPTNAPGLLAIMPRPRAGGWLEDELEGILRSGFTCLVSMLGAEEEFELELVDEGRIFESLGGEFRRFPVKDRTVPSNESAFGALASNLAARIGAGEAVAVHCRAGIGRSGVLAAGILVHLGESCAKAFDIVSESTGVRVPDTQEQQEWLNAYSARN